MIKATSCGGVVIFRGKILLLYKNYKNRYDGWVLPKGTVEAGEEYKETALREVHEETGVKASAIKYVGKSQYTFNTAHDVVVKQVHWYLMMADSYYSKPQKEEYFEDSGYYKYHEAYHLLRFPNERQILEDAYQQYIELKKAGLNKRHPLKANKSLSVTLIVARKIPHSVFSLAPRSQIGIYLPSEGYLWLDLV